MKCSGQSERWSLHSKREKGWNGARFQSVFSYSEDGVYEFGIVTVWDKGRPVRVYFDTKGIGVFDRMDVYENDTRSIYDMKGFSWEKRL